MTRTSKYGNMPADLNLMATVKGDAGTYKVWGVDWINHRVLLDRAGLEWHDIAKVAILAAGEAAALASKADAPELTPTALHGYALDYYRESGQCPTVSQAAEHYGVAKQRIIDTCDDYRGAGYLKPATGIRTGSGMASIKRKGDYLIEAY
ncbi:hypothetical protein PQR05_29380 [Paraburkholderia sediminicola]|uniref:hypothetical protein n=1 Tax=Paraburkholderia sediminicola TaxID=458836 RepID=UPI0038BCBCDA